MNILGLTRQFVAEDNVKNKEAVLSALSNYIKGNNFVAKRKFIGEYAGLEFLAALISDSHYNKSLRLAKKGLILMYDLVLNDDGIFEDA